MADDWPFPDDAPNVAVITTRGIIDGSDWIALVSLDEDDGGWQFIGTRGAREDEAMVVALRSVFESDVTIADLADLPLGWQARRETRDGPWQRNPKPE
ncbi:MAG: hypothetical protein ACJ8E3_06935 [Sphingomicrobium sp.]